MSIHSEKHKRKITNFLVLHLKKKKNIFKATKIRKLRVDVTTRYEREN